MLTQRHRWRIRVTETFTTKQVSEVLGVPEATIRSWRFSGAFAAIGRGGEPYIFRPHDVAVLVIGARLSRAGFPPGHSFRVASAAAGDVIACRESRPHRKFVNFVQNGAQTIVVVGETPSDGMSGFAAWSTLNVAELARELSELLAGLRLKARFGPGAFATRSAQVEAVRDAR